MRCAGCNRILKGSEQTWDERRKKLNDLCGKCSSFVHDREEFDNGKEEDINETVANYLLTNAKEY